MNVERILSDARDLAFPRYPGSEGDRRAIEWLTARLRDTGLDVAVEEFSYDLRPVWRRLRALLVGAAVLVGAAGSIAPDSPVLASLLVLTALAAGGSLLAWAPWLERLYRRPGPTRTANVVARRPADAPRLTLVFLAHHDSKSQNLSLPVRAGLTLLAVAGALALLALLAVALARGASPPAPWTPAAGLAAAAALIGLSTLRSGNHSPGGVDNAGSVGILLELARTLPAAVPADVELVFLSPGAEEDHMVGAMRWLDAHRDELRGRPVRAINFDGAGIPGRVSLLERYGFGKRFAPHLSAVARRAAAELDIPVRGVFLPPALGVDAIPFAHRGIECLTLASGSLGRAVLAVHSAGDVAENLDREALRQAAELGEKMAELLVAESG